MIGQDEVAFIAFEAVGHLDVPFDLVGQPQDDVEAHGPCGADVGHHSSPEASPRSPGHDGLEQAGGKQGWCDEQGIGDIEEQGQCASDGRGQEAEHRSFSC